LLKDLKPKSESETITTRIIEFCCDKNSEIGVQATKVPNVEVLRCTEEHDVLTRQGMQRCIDYANANPGTHLWASIPCAPWSNIRNLNLHLYGNSFETYLNQEKKKKSLKVMGRFFTLARIIRELGGTVCFEWPKDSSGWKERLTQRWIQSLETETVRVDGCAMGLRSLKTGLLLYKPWRIETTCQEMKDVFKNCTCSGEHKHQPCEGSETTRSGFYTPMMSKKIVMGFRKHDMNKVIRQHVQQQNLEETRLAEELANTATKEEIKAFTDS
jgi:hypothetical protein